MSLPTPTRASEIVPRILTAGALAVGVWMFWPHHHEAPHPPAVVHVQRTATTAPLPPFRLSPTTAPRAGTQTISCRPGATCVAPTQLTS